MPAYGASRPLRRLPAMVSFLSRKPALSLDGRNRSSCPTPAVRNTRRDRLNRVERRPSTAVAISSPVLMLGAAASQWIPILITLNVAAALIFVKRIRLVSIGEPEREGKCRGSKAGGHAGQGARVSNGTHGSGPSSAPVIPGMGFRLGIDRHKSTRTPSVPRYRSSSE